MGRVVRRRVVWLLVASLLPAPSLQAAPIETVTAFSREGTQQWDMRSDEGRRYRLFIALPKGPAPAGGYPILYVLDADSAFLTVADAVRTQEVLYGPVAVVGIGYPDEEEARNRAADMSLVADIKDARAASRSSDRNGKADRFLSFIVDRVKPAVAERVPVDPERQALFGHSLGGLMALHALFARPGAFQIHVAGSPSIWAGGKLIWDELEAFRALPVQKRTGLAALITVGALEAELQPEEKKAADAMGIRLTARMIEEMDMVGNADAFARRLRGVGAVAVDHFLFTDESHTSVIPAYLGRGVRHVLRRFYPPR